MNRKLIRVFFRDRLAVTGLVIATVLILVACWPGAWLPSNPRSAVPQLRLQPPVWIEGGELARPLGTDQLGRDILSRVIVGTRVSLAIAFSAVLISAFIGITAGVAAGYFGGLTDSIIMRLVDIQLAFPLLLVIIALVAILGASLPILIGLLGLSGWAQYARLVRAETLSVREREYVAASRAIGNSSLGIIWRHVLPNISTTTIVIGTFELARILLIESSISFLGLGVQPPTPSWGTMIADGRNYIYQGWWVATIPGMAIVLAVTAFNFIGDGLRDILDPTSR